MRTIYLDSMYRCHVQNDGTMTAVGTELFDGKSDAYTEGYRFVPDGHSWTREDGVVFRGPVVAPWQPYAVLAAAQAEYERNAMEITNLNSTITELDTALLQATYASLVE